MHTDIALCCDGFDVVAVQLTQSVWAFLNLSAPDHMFVPRVVTIETWQAHVIAALQTGLTNARTEGYNRIVKHVGRIAFGFRNPDNQRRRVRWACTRRSRQGHTQPAPMPLLTAKSPITMGGSQNASKPGSPHRGDHGSWDTYGRRTADCYWQGGACLPRWHAVGVVTGECAVTGILIRLPRGSSLGLALFQAVVPVVCAVRCPVC